MNKLLKTICYIIIIAVIVLIFILLNKLGKSDEENYKKCLENYSVNYCTKSIYGVY